MLWLFWLLGRGAGSFDGIDRDERHCEQLAGTSDILGAGLAGEQAVVADAMKPCGNTCIRKRRMNSEVSSVITLYRSGPSMR